MFLWNIKNTTVYLILNNLFQKHFHQKSDHFLFSFKFFFFIFFHFTRVFFIFIFYFFFNACFIGRPPYWSNSLCLYHNTSGSVPNVWVTWYTLHQVWMTSEKWYPSLHVQKERCEKRNLCFLIFVFPISHL